MAMDNCTCAAPQLGRNGGFGWWSAVWCHGHRLSGRLCLCLVLRRLPSTLWTAVNKSKHVSGTTVVRVCARAVCLREYWRLGVVFGCRCRVFRDPTVSPHPPMLPEQKRVFINGKLTSPPHVGRVWEDKGPIPGTMAAQVCVSS